MDAGTRVVVTLCVVVAVATAPAAAVGDATSPCFPGNGHEFVIGGNGASIDLVVFLSLFENLGGEGGVGMEARGAIGDQPIVHLRSGIAFAGIGPATAFLSNPFSRFSVVYDYSMTLPMFASAGIDSSYEDDGSPVRGVQTKRC
jgi:hypothetical protein